MDKRYIFFGMWFTYWHALIRSLIHDLHRNQSGDIPVGTILIISLVVIPLILLLVVFRVELWTGLIDAYVEMRGEEGKIKF